MPDIVFQIRLLDSPTSAAIDREVNGIFAPFGIAIDVATKIAGVESSHA